MRVERIGFAGREVHLEDVPYLVEIFRLGRSDADVCQGNPRVVE
jgi:hypothetical protein